MFKKLNSFKNAIMETELLYKNNLIDNIYDACTCCYDNTKELNYLQKKEYIEKRINAGHESILEHGRLAILISNINNVNMIANIAGYEFSKWLEFYTVELEDGTYNLIINGSIRAYKHFINNITNDIMEYNKIALSIVKTLINNTPKELYGNKFKLECFTNGWYNFIDVESSQDTILPYKGIHYPNITISGIPDIKTNKDCSKEIVLGTELSSTIMELTNHIMSYGFCYDIIDNIIPITVVFKNMSRTATHQLVRHRNAITQESQRYVNASNMLFTIPMENYDDTKKYEIQLFGQKSKVSLSELATEICKVYNQLLSQGLKKEEARAYLPSNINCGRLYMTFTLSSMKAFLKLRTDQHAQYEIRKYAQAIKSILTSWKII